MKAVTNVHIDYLLGKLRDNPEEVLSLIDGDEMLNQRDHDNGLVIANASSILFTPEWEHQLYAKGIVYRRDPYEVVSLPLLKIYNHGEKGKVDEVTHALAQDEALRVSLPFKDDGYMAQIFEYDGEVYVSTRSMLEGVDINVHGADFDYVGAIRRIAEDQYPALLDPEVIRGKTIVCEALHPECESGVTKYGDREDLIVLSVFDLDTHTYWTNDRVMEWAEDNNCKPVEYLAKNTTLAEAVETVLGLEDADWLPEGGVICFEKDGRIVHRVKAKTERWRWEFALRYSCSIKTVTKICFGKPEFEKWEALKTYLIDEGSTSEETLEYYKKYHTQYLDWLAKCRSRADEVRDMLAECLEEVHPVDPSEEQKALALYAKDQYTRADFALIMNCYNSESVILFDVMWQHELYSGIKGEILDAKQKAKEQSE